MKLKRADGLEPQFGDARLEPRPEFMQQLARQLAQPSRPRRRVWRGRRLAVVGGVLALALVLVAVPLLWPSPATPSSTKPKSPLARTILLKDLYATAMADKLPEHSGITFWDVTQTDGEGPAAAACNANIGSSTSRTLFFKKANVTAMWSADSYGNSGMYYSDDADIPAFNIDALTTAQNGQFSWALDNGTLADANGNPLPGNPVTAIKTSGTYEIYATYPTLAKPDGTLLKSCPKRLLDLKIDAATGMFTEADEYNGTIAPANLADKIQQTIKTATGDFTSVEPQFEALGFNLQQAKANTANNPAQAVNETAGYQFLYSKSALGKAELTQEKNSDGSVGVYVYHFAKQPNVVTRLYTAKAQNQTPKDLDALKARAAANGWHVLYDNKQPDVVYPGYPSAPTETYEATDGTTEYIMFATGTPDIPYVYIEGPLAAEGTDNFFELSQVMLFKPSVTTPSSQE